MPKKPAKAAVIAIGIASLLAAGTILFGITFPTSGLAHNFQQMPPASVYQRVFEQPPLPGIVEIRASGRHYFTKQWVWLRFRADKTTRRNFLASLSTLTPLNEAEAQKIFDRISSANPRYDRDDQRAVGWHDTKRIPHPEIYEWSNGRRFLKGDPGAWFWNGYLIIDTERDTVFIRATGA